MDPFVGYLIDAALMLFLGIAIYFGVRLNRQIAVIRSGREELEGLITSFTKATERAEKALGDLRAEVASSVTTSRTAQQKAAELCDDLEFLIKRGEKVADALEAGVRQGSQGPSASRRVPSRSASMAENGYGAGSNRHSPSFDEEPRPELRAETGPSSGVGSNREPALPRSSTAGSSAAKKAKAKSKSDLLKALRDMR